jgi:two-component system cell cycle sensor histidine kinase/response regulator CckA
MGRRWIMDTRTQPFVALQYRKLHLFILLLGVLVVFSVPFLLSSAFAEKSPDEILAGVHRNFPPHYSIDEKTKKPTGFAVDIMDEVAKRAGLKIRYVVFDEWPPLIQALKEGRIDIIPNIGIVDERKAAMDFTGPVEAFDIRIFVRETTADILSIDDLQGRKVAVVRDNKGLSIIQEYGKANPFIFSSLDEALLSLLSGNTDALVYPTPPVLHIAAESKLSERIKTVGKPLLEIKRGIAVGKGKTDLLNKLDATVKELTPTQEYKKIYARWYVTPAPYWNIKLVLIVAGIIIVLVIIIFAVWHYLSLMRINVTLKEALEEQKKAQEMMRRSEELFKVITSSNPDHLIVQDKDLRYSFVMNPQLGLTELDMIGKTDQDFLSKEDADKLTEIKQQVLKTGSPAHVEVPLTSPNGEQQFFSGAYIPKFDGKGHIDGLIGYFRNVTEYRLTEAALKRSEERYRLVVENTTEAIVVVQDGRAKFVNRGIDWAGYTPEEYMSIPVMETVHPEDRKAVEQRYIEKISGLTNASRHTYRGLSKSGQIHWIEVSSVLIDWEGRPATLNMIMDITERKRVEEMLRESEENYRQLFDNSPAGIYQVDFRTGKFLKANDVICKYLGCTQEEITSHSPYDVLTEQSKQLLSERLTKIELGETVINNPEYEWLDNSGRCRWLQLNSKNIYNPDGLAVGADVVAHEITDRKLAENEAARVAKEWQITFDATNDAIWILDKDQRVLRSNKTAERFFHRPVGEMIGKHCWEIVHDIEQPIPECPVLRLQKSLDRESMELQVGERWLEVNVDPILDAAGRYSGAVHIVSDISEYKKIETVQLFLAQTSTGSIEKPFFERLAEFLAQNLDMDFVCIDRLEGNGLTARTLAVWYNGKFDDNVSYALKDTPCGEAVGKNVCCFPANVCQFFPHDQVLQELRAESYVGVTLWSHIRQPIGLIAVVGCKPLANRKLAETILEMVAVRAAGELERLEAEEALNLSKQRLELTLQAAGAGTWDWDMTSQTLKWSKELYTLFGLDSDGTVATFDTWNQILHPDDREQTTHRIEYAIKEKIPLSNEYRIILSNGQIRWINALGDTTYDHLGKPVWMTGICTDISERKRAEEEMCLTQETLKRLANEMEVLANIGRVISSTLDIEEVYERFATEARKLIPFDRIAVYLHSLHEGTVKVAYVSGEEIPGRHRGDSFPLKNSMSDVLIKTRESLLDYSEADAEMHRKFHDDNTPSMHTMVPSLLRIPLIYRDEVIGLLHFGSKTKNAYTEKDLHLAERVRTQIAGAIGNVQMFNDLSKAEESLRESKERLLRSEKMEVLGQLAGGVAHDLNNILGIMSGYSELLLEEIPEGSRSKSHVEKILQSTQKGAAIIQDLLTLARRGVAVSDVINLNSIVSKFFETPVFDKLKDYHPRVIFRTEYDQNLLNLKGSPVHLEKTLINLVSNAAEAISGEGEVKIRTENRHLEKPIRGYDEVKMGDYAVLMVSDTGMGIPAENLQKIFEPFYTKKKMGRSGTGLGLAIVWGSVKDHNGYIDVQTEAGKGTTFTLYFPITREELTAQKQTEPIEQYTGSGESVLVVDDIAEQREIASKLLTRLGYHVHEVSCGEDALEYLKVNKADILVLDMIMTPGIDGLETYKQVLAINPLQKAILVSGFSETERVGQAQQMGAGAYIKKPYVLQKIGMAIRDELARK